MPWTRPQHDKAAVRKAANFCLNPPPARDRNDLIRSFEIITNWRSCHAYPLHVIAKTLKKRAQKIDPNAIIAKRLKRLPSILLKLERFKSMELTKMQDLGGCRAVLGTIEEVHALVGQYEKGSFKATRFLRKKDYIASPKSDGYRSIHLIYEYQSAAQKASVFNGLQIEIQVRTREQHAWATALETIDAFKDRGLKAGKGTDSWTRFFVLSSNFIALWEDSPEIPGSPRLTEWFVEFEDLCSSLDALSVLEGIRTGMSVAANVPAAANYILILNSKERRTDVESFPNEETAAERYQTIEQQTLDQPEIQAVMVSIDSLHNLRAAYPNYYMDASLFIRLLESFLRAIDEQRQKHPGRFASNG